MGIRDIPWVFLAPRRVFARVEDVPAWGWPLVVLLTVVTFIGYAKVETGLIDRAVDEQVRASIAQIDAAQRDVVERSALRDLYDREYKLGEFKKLLTRIQVILAEPARTLASSLLTAALLYGIVALAGRRAEWHTLLTICVYAGFIDALRLLVSLGLMLQFTSLEVDTSPALLAWFVAQGGHASPTGVAALAGALTGFDPFRLWFWAVVLIGLSVTAQLRGWRAWLICSLCWLAGIGLRCGLNLAASMSAGAAAAATGTGAG